MRTYIALLRAINLAGHNKVSMADLRQMFAGLGYKNVRSVLQTGNLVFDTQAGVASRLESSLEGAAQAQLGLTTDFFVRTAAEWQAMISANPFQEEAELDPAHLVVMFLKSAPDRKQVVGLETAITGREVARVNGKHAYIVYPDGIGRSRLTTALIENRLGTRGTGRNWNTVLKLQALSG